jgi:hypothetical protein
VCACEYELDSGVGNITGKEIKSEVILGEEKSRLDEVFG